MKNGSFYGSFFREKEAYTKEEVNEICEDLEIECKDYWINKIKNQSRRLIWFWITIGFGLGFLAGSWTITIIG